jgi:phosphatidylglycerol---prolipoprotein diacylglyceryl transferase
MLGELFTLFEVAAPSYFILLVVGFAFATAMGAVWAKRVGQNPDVVVDLGLLVVILGIVGSRLLHVIADGYFWDYVHLCTDPSLVDWQLPKADCLANDGLWEAGHCRPREADCLRWAKFWYGGYTFYGGLIAATGGAWFLFKRDRFPFWKGVDMAGMMIPIGLGFGRLGCFLAGCCFGSVAEGPFTLSFPGWSPASEWQTKRGLLASARFESLHVHPTQLYEAGAAFAIAALMILYVHERKKYDGQVFAMFVGSYACARFLLEFLRSDDRGSWFGFSTSQWIGVLLLPLAYAIHRYRSGVMARRMC